MRIVSTVSVLAALACASCLDDRRARVAETDGEVSDAETELRDAQQGFVDVAVTTNSAQVLSDMCVTLQVNNADGEIVIADSICSSQLGNGRGDLTYIMTCDASAPRTTVNLWIDSITPLVPGPPLRNPCPGEGHDPDNACQLEVLCIKDGDAIVEFQVNLVE